MGCDMRSKKKQMEAQQRPSHGVKHEIYLCACPLGKFAYEGSRPIRRCPSLPLKGQGSRDNRTCAHPATGGQSGAGKSERRVACRRRARSR